MPKLPSLLLLLSGLLLWNGKISTEIGFFALSYAQDPPKAPQLAPDVDPLKDDPFKEIPPQPPQTAPVVPPPAAVGPPPATLPVANAPVATPAPVVKTEHVPPPIAAPVASTTPTPEPIFSAPSGTPIPPSIAATPAPLPEVAPLGVSTDAAPPSISVPGATATAASPSPSPAATEIPTPAAAEASPAPEVLAPPVAVEATPTPAETAKDEPKFGETGYVSPYEKSVAHWAYGLRVGFNQFPFKNTSIGDSFQLYTEYILPFHTIGDFSIGLHLGSFPLSAPESGIPYPVYENFSMGASFRYALRFSHSQIFIPVAGGELDYYSLKAGLGSDKISGTNPGFIGGLMIALDPMDPEVAHSSYELYNMVHAYLTLEVRSVTISNDLFNLSGSITYFGLRLEFE